MSLGTLSRDIFDLVNSGNESLLVLVPVVHEYTLKIWLTKDATGRRVSAMAYCLKSQEGRISFTRTIVMVANGVLTHRSVAMTTVACCLSEFIHATYMDWSSHRITHISTVISFVYVFRQAHQNCC